MISLRWEVWANITSQLRYFLLKCLYQAMKVRGYMCVRISIFAIYRLDFGTVPIVWYFFFISLISILFYESRHYQISIYTIALHISWLNNYIILSTAPIRSATHTHICYLSVNGFNKLSLYSHGYVPLVVNTSRSFPHS
jgi:hypothetical protein